MKSNYDITPKQLSSLRKSSSIDNIRKSNENNPNNKGLQIDVSRDNYLTNFKFDPSKVESKATKAETTNKISKSNRKLSLSPFQKIPSKRVLEGEEHVQYEEKPIKYVPSVNHHKPSLTRIQSFENLDQYSKSKKYEEDKYQNEFYTIDESSKESLFDNSSKPTVPTPSYIDDYEKLLKYQEDNLPVPLDKKDDEEFKIKVVRRLRRASVNPNKSAKRSDVIEADYEKRFHRAVEYSELKGRKDSVSVKKIYDNSIDFYNDKGEKKSFPIFKDTDIGIYEYWQKDLIESQMDEDINTDDEQLAIANSYCVAELREALEELKKNKSDAIHNWKLYSFCRGKHNK